MGQLNQVLKKLDLEFIFFNGLNFLFAQSLNITFIQFPSTSSPANGDFSQDWSH